MERKIILLICQLYTKTKLKYGNSKGQIIEESNLHLKDVLVLKTVKIEFGNKSFTILF